MIPIAFRGTGVFVIVYAGVCIWLVGYFFPHRTFQDPSFRAWVFFYATILTTLHALTIWAGRKGEQGHGAPRPRGIWHDSLFFIPVLVWPLIFAAICIYSFVQA